MLLRVRFDEWSSKLIKACHVRLPVQKTVTGAMMVSIEVEQDTTHGLLIGTVTFDLG